MSIYNNMTTDILSESETENVIKNSATETATICDAEPWVFYIIQNRGCTYAGVSPDPVKRLRKHNGEIGGGAKYTLSKGPGWTHVCLVHGFQTKIQALQFEWAVKHVPPRNEGGLINRLKKLYTVLHKANWTSKSPNASGVPLLLEWKIQVPPDIAAYTYPPYVSLQEYVMS
jgi:predicted GIY-YIG superfamily endonuclease